MPSEKTHFTLQELADATGLEARTVRSYVEKGLLPGPDTLGRSARYPKDALDRLRVLLLVRDANRGLSLDQIRVLLQSLTPAQLRDVAEGRQRIAAVIDTDAGSKPPGKADALSYLQSFKEGGPFIFRAPGASWGVREEGPSYASAGAPAAGSPELRAAEVQGAEQSTALARAARLLGALVELNPSVRSVRSETWHRLAITKDIELAVRGEFGPEELAELHRIGDALKILFTKGAAR
ncbi:MAG: MerR family transcriptional regulator [Planctomycetota bacterium]